MDIRLTEELLKRAGGDIDKAMEIGRAEIEEAQKACIKVIVSEPAVSIGTDGLAENHYRFSGLIERADKEKAAAVLARDLGAKLLSLAPVPAGMCRCSKQYWIDETGLFFHGSFTDKTEKRK